MNIKFLQVPLALIMLLTLLLLMGWGNVYILEKGASSLMETAEKMRGSIEKENWQEAKSLYLETEKSWSKLRSFWPMLIHHQEMDRIEESMEKLKSYLHYQEPGDSMAELYSLIKYIRHIPEKEKLNLQNIF